MRPTNSNSNPLFIQHPASHKDPLINPPVPPNLRLILQLLFITSYSIDLHSYIFFTHITCILITPIPLTMATDVLSRKKGVIVGDDVLNLFRYAQEKQFAIPAIVCHLVAHRNTVEILTTSERHIFLHSRSVARGCAR